MNDDSYARHADFYRPSDDIAPRCTVEMTPEEQARARNLAFSFGEGWMATLLKPLLAGTWAPFFLFTVVTGSLGMDSDALLAQWGGELLCGNILFVGVWIWVNRLASRHNVRNRYWRDMPEKGQAEVESHTLCFATVVWSDERDNETSYVDEWTDGKLQRLPDGRTRQWILAKTTTGIWLVLSHMASADHVQYGRPFFPMVNRRLNPTQDLSIVFAPRTNLWLGFRFSGLPIPWVMTAYLLSDHELLRLTKTAPHWNFPPPLKYGVVDPHEADWINRLSSKARKMSVPIDCAGGQLLGPD